MHMAQDSPRWKAAYEAYKKTKKTWSHKKLPNSSVKTIFNKERWLETTKDFYRWKKTEEYEHWRNRQFGQQDGRCYYCQKSLIGIRTNVEHIVPRSKGGTNDPKNLVLACWKCNKSKGSEMLSLKRARKLKKVQSNKKYQYKQYMEQEEYEAIKLRDMFRED